MRGKTIPTGYVSINTFLLYLQGNTYRACCDDFEINLFIAPPKGLERYMEQASQDWSNHQVYTPCVIEKRVHSELSHHSAKLLIPPKITKDSRLFRPGLMVPQMKVKKVLGNNNSPVGYILISPYLGSQELYASPTEMLRELNLSSDVEFQGMVVEVPRDETKRPKVIINKNSRSEPDIFRQNREMLEGLDASYDSFWWNMNIVPSEAPITSILF